MQGSDSHSAADKRGKHLLWGERLAAPSRGCLPKTPGWRGKARGVALFFFLPCLEIKFRARRQPRESQELAVSAAGLEILVVSSSLQRGCLVLVALVVLVVLVEGCGSYAPPVLGITASLQVLASPRCAPVTLLLWPSLVCLPPANLARKF